MTRAELPKLPIGASDSEKLSWLVGAVQHVANEQLALRQEIERMHADLRDQSHELVGQHIVLKDTAGRVQDLHERLVAGEQSISELQETEERRQRADSARRG